jgi:hypothetical protein
MLISPDWFVLPLLANTKLPPPVPSPGPAEASVSKYGVGMAEPKPGKNKLSPAAVAAFSNV